jgi:site-specific DNA-methyltransferase (adenine-specific)
LKGLSEREKRSQARALNLARRHLDHAAKRQVIADELRENPERSNRWVARSLGVDHKTVARVRNPMGATGELPQLSRTLGSDGKYRPAARGIGGHEAATPRPVCESPDRDEERILRAAAEIRQRRVAERLRAAQERRRQARPVRVAKGSPVLHGDCLDVIPTLADGSVGLVVTSPPYADQRAGHYKGVSEEDYPEFTVGWMSALAPKMAPDGSVLLVIRPHVAKGVLSDYVLRTRLAVREAGWHECEELIWLKPDAPPLGSLRRPRRTWESVLWFSRSSQPYCDLKACGRESVRVGFEGSVRFGVGVDSPLSRVQARSCTGGTARVSDVIVAPVGGNERGLEHPAVFPVALAEQLIRTFSQEGDLVLDPFCGSGQTLLAAMACGRRYLGVEREAKCVRVALGRLGR